MQPFKLSLSAIEYREDPFTNFGKLRALGPMVRARVPIFGNVWLATTYRAVSEVLKNDQLFCRDSTNAGRSNFAIFRWLMPGFFQRIAENMIGKDEPDHRRLRSLVDQAFQRQSIAELRPRIESITAEQLDSVCRCAAKQGSVDLLDTLARPIPLAVICELLGLPQEDRPKFRRWFSPFSNVRSFAGIFRVVPGLWKTMRYFRQQFDEVRRHPRPGLISALVEAEDAGDRLTDDELQSMVMLLLLAGHETTVHLISTSILTMIQLQDVREALIADWSQLPDAVEEMLRFNSSAQFAKPRFVTRAASFHGKDLKRGEIVIPVLAAANYDPQQFDRPHEFVLGRERNFHLTFGAGPHVCLGLKLARAETEVVLQQLFGRWPNLQLADARPSWSRRLGMRSLDSLKVVLG